jgi:acetyl-CoA carboxylase carboxyl transferase subunit alpha
MLENRLVDGIVGEPLGGAHHDPQAAYSSLKEAVLRCLDELAGMDAEDRIQQRIAKFSAMGVVVDA